MSDAGVIGYDAYKIGSVLNWLAATRPYASARLPVMLRYVPGASRAGAIEYGCSNSSAVSPK